MKLILRRSAVRSALAGMRRLLSAVAVGLLGYCGYVVADRALFQRREDAHLSMLIAGSPAAAEAPPWRPGREELIGRIEIPRLGLSVMVVEGVDDGVLRRAVGHVPGTALPGEIGNVGLSGHRDSYFRPLAGIRPGDRIAVTTPGGVFRYRAVSMSVVDPSDVAVLRPDGRETLTLITCYPFAFVGAAPERFIVRASREF